MTNSRPGSDSSPARARTITANRSAPAPRLPIAPAVTRSLSARPRIDPVELQDLLEANLAALRALHDEHHRMLKTSLQAIDGICTELRAELHAIGNARAPWVRAMSETRALLFVALRELVVGAHEAELEEMAKSPDITDLALDEALADSIDQGIEEWQR